MLDDHYQIIDKRMSLPAEGWVNDWRLSCVLQNSMNDMANKLNDRTLYEVLQPTLDQNKL